MSKQRARARAAREHEAALRTAARASEAERRERRAARARRLRRVTGVRTRRRNRQTSLLLAGMLAVDVLVWVARPDWPARLGIVVLTVLAAPMVVVLVPRRR